MPWRPSLLAIAALAALAPSARAQCEPQWSAAFSVEELNGPVRAITAHDDGSGSSMFIGGDFTAAGDLDLAHVARWDGQAWWPLGSGLDGAVRAMAVFDEDGPGPARPALFVVGDFTQAGGAPAAGIARWDGASWSAVGAGLAGSPRALAATNTPQLRGLYAGGMITEAGGHPAIGVARWTGEQWESLNTGPDGDVLALTIFDLGSGPELFAGGQFLYTGTGTLVTNIARYDGLQWRRMGDGVGNAAARIEAVAGFIRQDGARALYAGGEFVTGTPGGTARNIVKFTNTAWQFAEYVAGPVHALAATSGPAPQLLAGGTQVVAQGGNIDGYGYIATTNGAGSSGIYYAIDAPPLAVAPDPMDPHSAIVGGAFTTVGFSTLRPHLARWGVGSFDLVPPPGPSGTVFASIVHDDGDGPALYVAGSFNSVNGETSPGIAKRVGDRWVPIAPGLPGTGYALTSFDPDGTGPQPAQLIAATSAGTRGRVLRWDSAQWTDIGGPFFGPDGAPIIFELASYDDGSGPALYAAGQFHRVGTTTVRGLARWDGQSWTPVGGTIGDYGFIETMTVFDEDGDGPLPPSLFIGGGFDEVGPPDNPVPATGVARWDGAAWSAVGGGVDPEPGVQTRVSHMLVADPDGPGPVGESLYLAGSFAGAGGIQTPGIVRWDGAAWSGLAGGIGPLEEISGRARALALYDDGSGPALYIAGRFETAGSTPARNIARWNGESWSALGDGLDHIAYTLTVFDDDAQPGPTALYAGGQFRRAGGTLSAFIARWGPGRPIPASHPDDKTANSGSSAAFHANAPGAEPLTVQWRKDTQPLTDGPTISGATTPRLTLLDVRQSDQGLYDAVFTNACGEITTDPAALTVLCPADWDASTTLDSADIAAFLAAWLASIQSGDLAADFDSSGDVTSVDISAFLSAWLTAVTEGC